MAPDASRNGPPSPPDDSRNGPPAVPGDGTRILVVDDEAASRELLRILLEDAGYETAAFVSGSMVKSLQDVFSTFVLSEERNHLRRILATCPSDDCEITGFYDTTSKALEWIDERYLVPSQVVLIGSGIPKLVDHGIKVSSGAVEIEDRIPKSIDSLR